MTAASRPAGWHAVWTAFAVALFAWGLGFYGLSIFLQTLHATRGWSIAIVSAAVTAHYLASACIVAWLPELHRRFGLALVTGAGVAATALGVVAWSQAGAPWQLFPAALLTSAGWATTSGAAINAIVSPWFDRDRARALSLAFNGASAGGLVFPALWVGLIALVGFPAAAATVAVAMAAVLLPLCRRFLRLAPPARGGHAAAGRTLRAMSRAGLVRDRRFATMSGAFALGLFAQTGIVVHLAARLAPAYGAGLAASAISLVALCAIAGRTLLGRWLGERDRRIAAALNFWVQSAGSLLLGLGDGPVVLGLGCVLFGLGVGNMISLPPLIAQREFAPTDVPVVVALVTAINQAVFAVAPTVLGVLRDLEGDYRVAFALAACVQVAAGLLVLAGPARRSPP
ncbi:MAG: MFS transporter [Alphaproteobacteria bacterium]|nr:MFS transporter [Alphaproteobacteria bacterium]